MCSKERISYADKTIEDLQNKLTLAETSAKEQGTMTLEAHYYADCMTAQKAERFSQSEQSTMYQIRELQDKLKARETSRSRC